MNQTPKTSEIVGEFHGALLLEMLVNARLREQLETTPEGKQMVEVVRDIDALSRPEADRALLEFSKGSQKINYLAGRQNLIPLSIYARCQSAPPLSTFEVIRNTQNALQMHQEVEGSAIGLILMRYGGCKVLTTPQALDKFKQPPPPNQIPMHHEQVEKFILQGVERMVNRPYVETSLSERIIQVLSNQTDFHGYLKTVLQKIFQQEVANLKTIQYTELQNIVEKSFATVEKIVSDVPILSREFSEACSSIPIVKRDIHRRQKFGAKPQLRVVSSTETRDHTPKENLMKVSGK